jgi:hypothetical protein
MRTTISIPDEAHSEANEVVGSHPFSEFAGEAMAEGYRLEAQDSSLEAEWSEVETEDL